MSDSCSWCGKTIKPGKEKKNYKGKGVGMKIVTFIFGKSYCCERCRNSSARNNRK